MIKNNNMKSTITLLFIIHQNFLEISLVLKKIFFLKIILIIMYYVTFMMVKHNIVNIVFKFIILLALTVFLMTLRSFFLAF